jgi:ClpP class serine protease
VDGIAVIEIAGVLVHRGAWIGNSSGQTSYEGIAAQIDAAGADPTIRAVALEIDSFGGEIAGVFDLADRIRALRRSKPVWAFVAEHAFSAGYALAAQADRILLPRTGSVGSIGVLVMHADLSRKLDQEGVAVTLVHSGQRKVDTNPYQPLPAQVQASIQGEIDGLRVLFAQTVEAGRAGRLTADAALSTEAACYRGAEAVAAGLADEVADLASGFAAFRRMAAQLRLGPVAGLSRRSSAEHRSPLPSTSASAPIAMQTSPPKTPTTRKDPSMAKSSGENAAPQTTDDVDHDPNPTPQPDDHTGDAPSPSDAGQSDEANSAADADAEGAPADGAAHGPEAAAQPLPQGSAAVQASTSNLAELSAQLRSEAAEIADIAAQASRLGIAVDAAKALREGTKPDALRRIVLDRAAALSDAQGIIAAAPSPVLPRSAESPIVAAAKRAATDTPRR